MTQPHPVQPRSTSTIVPAETSPSRPPNSILQPCQTKQPSKSLKVLRLFRSAFRSFPILTPTCKLPATTRHYTSASHIRGETRMTGTLFGPLKAHITLAIQDHPRSLPTLLLELTIPTARLLQKMEPGHVRIALECEKRSGDKTRLIDEPLWTMYCNGQKTGYGTRREATEKDLTVMELLHAVSMWAGVLPLPIDHVEENSAEGELTYMRAHLERVVGSKDSETYYLLTPDGNSGPELSIFFIRI